ncbi:MAG TPA: Txe/YoeB family addiction module toxin [Candidatus Saccharimonadia bacterium]
MSNRLITFTATGWSDYTSWQTDDKKIIQKINRLIEEIMRTPFAGTGKPEPLRENLAGYWSRRITDEHRLVYSADDDQICIIACRYHYK